MNMLLIYVTYTALIMIEVFIIDPHFWMQGKKDKPWSTIFYLVGCAWVGFLFGFNLWEIGLFTVCIRAMFDPLINISGSLPSGKRYICYHSDSNLYERFWRKVPCQLELVIRFAIYLIPLFYNFWK